MEGVVVLFYILYLVCHVAANQIKDIKQIWVFFCHKSYEREVEILHFKENSSINNVIFDKFFL